MTLRTALLTFVVLPIAAFAIVAREATKFSLKDPKSVNAMRFTLDGRFESMSGLATDISGEFTFDAKDVAATRGKVIVQTSSLATSHANMTEHMHSARWMDVAKHPTIEFDIKKIEGVHPVEGKDQTWTMSVTGDFSMHGATKSLTIPVRLTNLPGQLSKRNRLKGDLVMLRSSFVIKRSDFGIDGEVSLDIVSDEVKVDFSIAAFAPAPAL